MTVKPEIDDMPDTQRVEIFELQFGRLTRRSDMIVEATPVVDGFRVGMSYPPHRRNTGREGEFPSAPFRSGCLQDTKLLKRDHAIDPEHDQAKAAFGGNQCDTPAPIFSVRTSQPETTLQIVASRPT
jgi:hypothetical protein